MWGAEIVQEFANLLQRFARKRAGITAEQAEAVKKQQADDKAAKEKEAQAAFAGISTAQLTALSQQNNQHMTSDLQSYLSFQFVAVEHSIMNVSQYFEIKCN
jgi:hypothetical protein